MSAPASPTRGGPSPRVLVAGEALIDIVLSRHDAPPSEHVGGGPTNVAVGLAALGHTTVLATCVGEDRQGAQIRNYLQEHHVQLAAGSVQPGVSTSSATARIGPGGVAGYEFSITWTLPPVDLTGIGHVHTGSIGASVEPGGSAVFELVKAARGSATTSYDPNLRPSIIGPAHQVRPRVEELVGRSDVVKASSEDLEWLYAGAPVSEVAHLWGLLGPALVVLTRGADGAQVMLPRQGAAWQVRSEPVTVLDTIGAGDSFMAGLLSGLLDDGLLGGPEARHRLEAARPEQLGPALARAVATAAATLRHVGPTKK